VANNPNQSSIQSSQPQAQTEPNFKGSFLKFASIMVLMVITGLTGSYVWQKYFSPETKENQRLEEQYKKYQEFETGYKKAMAEDIYGGKTPQETLDLFVAALEQGNLELASKYFMLNSVGQRDGKWLIRIESWRSGGYLATAINDIKTRAIPDLNNRINEEDFKFVLRGDNGRVGAIINMQLNTYSNIWKIESI
jgi:hypothetical protein